MKLACAIYPDNHSVENMLEYIERLSRYQVDRVFMSLLQLNPKDDSMLDKYQVIIEKMKAHNMTVVADINEKLIEALGWGDDIVQHAKDMGIDIIRFDETSDLMALANLTKNDHDLKIELNMSTRPEILDQLIAFGANVSNITASHNFYPRKFTGLSLEHFNQMTQHFHDANVETAAFVNAPMALEGPWPLAEGLCTLEMHREMSLAGQIKFYKLWGKIDYVIIANQFISEEELKLATDILTDEISLTARIVEPISSAEKSIIAYDHIYRGDVSDYLVRSSQTRVVFADVSIEPRMHEGMAQVGDILIDNDLYSRYKGELYLVLKPHPIDQRTNIVAKIVEEEIPLLPLLQPWQAFKIECM